MDKIVCVLMSTHNGEKFLEEQLCSIFSQQGVQVHLVVRDDGSSDKTCEILEKYRNQIFDIILGSNIGCEKSFMDLLHRNYDAEYYAFADQDDIWDVDKLKIAISFLNKQGLPALYGSDLREFKNGKDTGRLIFGSERIKRVKLVGEKFFFSNVHGCTLVWNKELDDIIKLYSPNVVVGHDAWVCSIANALGIVFYDDSSHISYRIHENNTSGKAQSVIERLIRGTKHYLIKGSKLYRFADEFLKGYGNQININSSGYEFMYHLSRYNKNFDSKLWLLKSSYINSKPILDGIMLKISIIVNKY